MKFELDELPAAHRDVDEIFFLIGSDNLKVAIRFHEAVEALYEELCSTPLVGRVGGFRHSRLKGVRQLAVRGFGNYIVFYTAGDGVVTVLRVLHGARDVSRELLETEGEVE